MAVGHANHVLFVTRERQYSMLYWTIAGLFGTVFFGVMWWVESKVASGAVHVLTCYDCLREHIEGNIE